MKRRRTGVKVVRKVLADGTVRTYTYQRGEPKAPPPITVDEMIEQYRMSPGYRALAHNTKAIRLRAFDKIKHLGQVPVTAVKRRHVMETRDILADTPGIANQVVSAISVLLNFARDREVVEHNVAQGVKMLPTGHHVRWPDEAVDYATAPGNLPENLRRAVVLALYTGQRQTDCLAMLWSAYDGDGIAVKQQKTGAELWVPCHSALRAELDAWKRDAASVRILTSARGRPWPVGSNSFATTFCRATADCAPLAGLAFHGLRHTAASRMAEAGCSELQIGAVTGHLTLSTLSLYTRGARQKGMASAAILRLETVANNAPSRLKK